MNQLLMAAHTVVSLLSFDLMCFLGYLMLLVSEPIKYWLEKLEDQK